MIDDELEGAEVFEALVFVGGCAVESFADDLEVRGADAAEHHGFERAGEDEACGVIGAAPDRDELENAVEEFARGCAFAFVKDDAKRVMPESADGFIDARAQCDGEDFCAEDVGVFGEDERYSLSAW